MSEATVHTLRPLPPGRHHGSCLLGRKLGFFTLTETQYTPTSVTPWHVHHAPAFCLVLSGSYIERYRQSTLECRSPHVVFRPSGAEHMDTIGPMGAACVIIEPEDSWLADYELVTGKRLDPTAAASGRVTTLQRLTLEEFRSPDEATPLALEGLVLALLAEIGRPARNVGSGRPPWLVRLRDFLDAHFVQHLSLSCLAAEAGVHPVHLAATFRRAMGVSIGEYIRARRIEASQAALLLEDASIARIATTYGFASQSHFTRVFRVRTGLTPRAYQRQHARH